MIDKTSKKPGWKGARYQHESGSNTDRRVFNLKIIETLYCDKDYTLELLNNNQITKEGLLLLGKLKPNISSDPEFWLRWDAKSGELDIDIHGTNIQKANWAKATNGYQGHHTDKLVIDGKRQFKIKIKIPQRNIFEGKISFNLEHDVEIIEKVNIKENVVLKFTKRKE